VLPNALAEAGVAVSFNTEFKAGKHDGPVVLACGAEPEVPTLDAWRAGGREVVLAGECAGARTLIGATTSAYEAALRI
jgi:hypothetical protein